MEKTNKTVLVTGATSGIGLALANEFASHGYDLVIVARREQELARISADIESRYGVSCHTFSTDLGKEDAPQCAFNFVVSQGIEIDILINNAGVGDAFPFYKEEQARIESMINLNVRGTTFMTKLFLSQMVSRKSGTIVNIASTMAFAPSAWQTVYAATKAYVLSLTEALHEESIGTGVSVMALCPGLTDTGFFKSAGITTGNMKAAKPEDFARFAYNKITKGNGALYIHGTFNRLAALFARLFDRRTVRKTFAAVSKPQMREL